MIHCKFLIFEFKFFYNEYNKSMEETILIECSRQSSLEGTTRNDTQPAEWTCETGDGIVLDIGDKIQVHSGFVSERGAQTGTIEIKKRNRSNKVQALISTPIKYQNPYTPDPQNSSPYINPQDIYSHGIEIGGSELTSFEINDDETNIIISPYKTTNGEFYATLPRRHVGKRGGEGSAITNVWEGFDSSYGVYTNGKSESAGIMGNVVFNLDAGPINGYVSNFPDVSSGRSCQFCPADYKLVGPNGTNSEPHNQTFGQYQPKKGMIKNDCSRYTILRAKEIVRDLDSAKIIGSGDPFYLLGGSSQGTTTAQPGTPDYQAAVDTRDPALLYNWEPIREVFTMKAKEGFNSPNDVATEITEQMNKRSDLIGQQINYNTPGAITQKTLVNHYESPLFKPYNCASMLWNDVRYVSFMDPFNPDPAQPVKLSTDYAHSYMSMYQHIGVKRPDLWIQGRETNGPLGFFKSGLPGEGGNTPLGSECLNLGIRWNDTNIDNLNKLFIVQGKYDELFTDITQQGYSQTGSVPNYKITPNNHRFLHFNKQDDDVVVGSVSPKHYPVRKFGYDLYGGAGRAVPTGYVYDNSMATYPIFFDFNSDIVHYTLNDVGYCEDAGGGVSDINDLAYGWARKMRIDGTISPSGEDEFYIGVQFTKTGNKVPLFLFNNQDHIAANIFGNGRRFGYDYHFSAYGNAALVLYSGVVPTLSTLGDPDINNVATDLDAEYIMANNLNDSATGANKVNSGAFYHEIFLGADQPELIYDQISSRFSFSNLHIAERSSNIYNAGKLKSTGTDPAVSLNSNAATLCYKVNKAMLGNSYCPNVAPYNITLQLNNHAEFPSQRAFSNNLEPFLPYDSTAGLFLEDILVPSDIWSDNLIGVLGFYESQFVNDDTTRQTTINNRRDSSNLASLTTQGIIGSGDIMEWCKNGFGAPIYSLTKPLVYQQNALHKTVNILPTATIFYDNGANSTQITALDLPTKTARPYYSIRSDILPQSQFIGGNQSIAKRFSAVNRPVVGIVNKVNGYGDFYTSSDSQVIFTNTEKRVITSIKTSIMDPDGSYAKVSENSAVIYKVIKQRNIDLTPVTTLLQSKKKSDQLLGQQAESGLKDMANAQANFNDAFSF